MTPTDHAATANRRAWVRPSVDRLSTAAAEIAPRTAATDGAFTKTS